MDRRIFLPLHGFGQFVRVGALSNCGIALAVIAALTFSLVSSDYPVGEGEDESRLIGSFTGWLFTLIIFRYLVPNPWHPYELHWGDQRRTIDWRAFVKRWMIRIQLLFLSFAVLDIFA